MTCKECPFYWKDDGERWGTCHFEIRAWYDVPPCEEEEPYEEEPYDFDSDFYED